MSNQDLHSAPPQGPAKTAPESPSAPTPEHLSEPDVPVTPELPLVDPFKPAAWAAWRNSLSCVHMVSENEEYVRMAYGDTADLTVRPMVFEDEALAQIERATAPLKAELENLRARWNETLNIAMGALPTTPTISQCNYGGECLFQKFEGPNGETACEKCGAIAPNPLAAPATGDSIRDHADFREDLERLSAPGLPRKQAKVIRKAIYDTIDARVRNLLRAAPASTSSDAALRDALRTVAEWKFPDVGIGATGVRMTYGAAHGSNGERDYMRKIAADALATPSAITSPASVASSDAAGLSDATKCVLPGYVGMPLCSNYCVEIERCARAPASPSAKAAEQQLNAIFAEYPTTEADKALLRSQNPDNELAFNAQRLRNVAALAGLTSGEIPQDDATLDGARGAVLGQIAQALRQRATPTVSAAPSAKPYGWLQFIDGVKTQNFARDEEELADVKRIFRLMGHPGNAEYLPVYATLPAADAYAVRDAEQAAISFKLFVQELPKLKHHSSSYGGTWSSDWCVVVDHIGGVSTDRFTVCESTKLAIESGNRKHVSWTPLNSFSNYQAWAYKSEVKATFDAIRTAMAQAGEAKNA